MNIRITLSDGVPIYQQIVTQLRYQVAAGQLVVGSELPTIRAMAERLKVNPNTVARAYRELELEGLVEKRSTTGTFVSDAGTKLARNHRQRILADRIDQLLAESRQLGFTLAEVLEMTQRRDETMNSHKKASS